ncbi:MAG TPA: DUF4159 domain-containing protein, partial [Pirellulaceae bacterium]
NPEMTYATSLQTMAFATVEPARDRLLVRRNVDWLSRAQFTQGPLAGGWSYKTSEGSGRPDNSNSQFALLALHEAQQSGVIVSPSVWEAARSYWRKQQHPNGGWSYRDEQRSGSMTCAGIASLIITENHLQRSDSMVLNDRVLCCGAGAEDAAVELGLQWLARNFSVSRNPLEESSPGGAYHHYYLYGLERVGRMSGRRFIGRHDWYREGAQLLLRQQDRFDGSWTSSFLPQKEVSTAMALLFLAKGKRPVVISKLRHGPADDWNHHRHDVGNLSLYVEQRWGIPLTWQTMDLRQATTSDLLQSPVLFLSGKQALRWTTAHKEAVRAYLNQGGFLFAEAACGGEEFDRAFRQLMSELFPESPLRLLPPDHPVWFAEQQIPAEHLRPLYGIDSCCRTSVVYCPQDLGCYWELARGRGLNYASAVQSEVNAVLGIGANVLAYATGRELHEKLDVPLAPLAVESAEDSRSGSLAIAKILHGGGSDDAPAALRNLLRIFSEKLDLPINEERVLLPASAQELLDYPIAFMHGRRGFQWSEEERNGIRRFVEHGGVLLADSICGSPDFADAFRREMAAVFPERPLQRVPPGHPLFSDKFHGFSLARVRLNRPQARGAEEPLTRRSEDTTPFLEGILVDEQYGVVFSPYDLSCALENYSSLECLGYSREDAAKIGVNVLLYALQQ